MKYAEMLQDGSMSESFSPPNNHTTALREMEMDNRIAESSQTNNKNKNYNSNNKSNNKYIKNSKYHNNNSKKHNNKSGENVSSSKSSSSNMIGGGNSNENKNNNDKNYTSTSNRNRNTNNNNNNNNNNNITNKGMKRIITFYDPESMLSIPETVARGYVTLLCGGEHNHYKKKASANEQEQARNHFFTSKSNGNNNNNNNNNDDDDDKTPASTPQKSTSDEDVAKIALAFAALTDGNVIDTCFGVRSAMTSKSITTTAATTTTTSTPTNTSTSLSSSISPTVQINQRMVRDVKCAIEEAASNNDDIRIVAIEAYKNAFLLVIDGYDKLHRCSIFTRCVKQKKIQKHTLQSLEELFYEAECIIQQELQM